MGTGMGMGMGVRGDDVAAPGGWQGQGGMG